MSESVWFYLLYLFFQGKKKRHDKRREVYFSVVLIWFEKCQFKCVIGEGTVYSKLMKTSFVKIPSK